MKKVILSIVVLLALTLNAGAAAQHHRHTPQQELTDSARQEGVEAYSDTTAAVSGAVVDDGWEQEDADNSVSVGLPLDDSFLGIGAKNLTGILIVISVMLIIFVISPLVIIAALFYFINKNRKRRIALAQMAMQNGQPIPDQLLRESVPSDIVTYRKGIKQVFLGIGLIFFLRYFLGSIGIGIGVLVLCMGLGNVIISKTASRPTADSGEYDYADTQATNKEQDND
ncbi:MAG: hypothetical protein IJ710_04290 [Prevotella sp.]|nr:hypothetical protein [Prevotella sp.]